MVDGVTGYLVKRKELELKEKIDFLLNNNDLRKKLGKNARERILTKFTWEESVGRFLKIITDAGYVIK